MTEVIKKEVTKWLDAEIIYPIFDIKWASLVQCVPKKGDINVVSNESDELIPTRPVTGRVCMDYQKLKKATRNDPFPFLFIDQMLDRLLAMGFIVDGYLGYNHIVVAPKDQEKIRFPCP